MDEVYSQMKVKYVSGAFFGAENGQITKTLLCVMIKSICSKYRDVIVITPVVNINKDILYNVWKEVLRVTSAIGFDVAVTTTDGHQSNLTFFESKMLQNREDVSVENMFCEGRMIFPLFDTSHLFKNFYNNWRAKPYFECPMILPESTTVVSNLDSIDMQIASIDTSVGETELLYLFANSDDLMVESLCFDAQPTDILPAEYTGGEKKMTSAGETPTELPIRC